MGIPVQSPHNRYVRVTPDQWLLAHSRVAIVRFFIPMKFILARKDRMTQLFADDGTVSAGTILKTTPNVVTQVKSKESDGYDAVQVGFDTQKPERLSKPVLGHLKGKAFKILKEFKTPSGEFEVGKEITLETFAVGDNVTVVGTSKGRGFAGVVKRYNFKGGRRSHGQKHSERERGSSGGGPGRAGGRVALGMRMAGRMGTDRVTIKNLRVIHVDPVAGEIIVSGAVPGARDSLVEIMSA